jgi:voltage-gated potassium channel
MASGGVAIQPDESRRARWEAFADWPLTIAAVVFLAAYAWPILDPDLSGGRTQTCEVVAWAAWALFVVDYVVRFSLSRSRGRFVRGNLFDLATVVLPVLRPLRLLRLITLLSVLNRYAGDSLRGRVVVYVVGATSLTLFVAALAELDAERGEPGSNISDFGDALWWAATTMTTVGYGDHFPVSTTGRVVAMGLMIAGIALLGVVTATFASWLLDRVRELEEETQAATRHDVADLRREIRELRRALERGDAADVNRA